jgi:putative membrane protein
MTVRYTDARNPWPTLGAFHWGWLGLLALACALASIHPLDPAAYLMHQAGTVVGVMLLMWLTQIGKVSKVGFALTIGFILIHVLGAHYLYSFVPYNEWSKQYLGWDMDGYFGWSRNMYDRLVHFSYGLLLYRLMMDVFSTWFTASPRGRVSLLVIQFVMASSVFYEFIEWWIAIGMSPEAAESYNGQQGDMWDAHKDMALATLGAMMAWVLERLIYTVKRG